MFCANCGKEVTVTSKFCTYCGKAIARNQEVKETIPMGDKQPESSQMSTNKMINEDVSETGQTEQDKIIQEQAEQQETVQEQAEHRQIIQDKIEQDQTVYDQIIQEQAGSNQTINDNSRIQDQTTGKYKTQNQQEPIQPVHRKKRSKKLLIPAGIIIFIAVACASAFFIYQNYIMKQAVKVVSLFDEKEYEKALEIYDKYSDKKEAFYDNISEELSNRLDMIKEDYVAEKINYEDVLDQLQALDEFNNKTLSKKTSNMTNWMNKIEESRTSYGLANALYEAGDYLGAIEKYKLVKKEDIINYNLAAKQIKQAEESIKALEEANEIAEEKLRQEEERKNNLRNDYLLSAENYEINYDINSAVSVIENGLIELPGDQILQDMLTYYQGIKDLSKSVANFTSTKYEHTYMEGDIELLTLSLELPVLSENSIVYDKINQVFIDLQTETIASNDICAEDLKEYMYEEWFIPYSMEMSYSVPYNNNGRLCILVEGYSYTGGAHGYPIRMVYTFDLTTGNLLDLRDLLIINEYDFWSNVINEYEKLINENPDEYWDDSVENIVDFSRDYDVMNYYLTEEGICIFFFPYEIASYARGFVEIVIPYEGNEWMFAFLQGN